MRAIVFGPEPPSPLAEALAAAGVELVAAPAPQARGPGATAELAAALRSAEATLEGCDASCALITDDGDLALGAALTAVKLGIASAWLAPQAHESAEALTARVADLTREADGDPVASARALAELASAGSRIASP